MYVHGVGTVCLSDGALGVQVSVFKGGGERHGGAPICGDSHRADGGTAPGNEGEARPLYSKIRDLCGRMVIGRSYKVG